MNNWILTGSQYLIVFNIIIPYKLFHNVTLLFLIRFTFSSLCPLKVLWYHTFFLLDIEHQPLFLIPIKVLPFFKDLSCHLLDAHSRVLIPQLLSPLATRCNNFGSLLTY